MDSAGGRAGIEVPRSAFSGSPAPDGRTQPTEFAAPFERVVVTLKRMSSNYATLAVLDARRAAVQFAWLVGGGVFISVLLVTAWLACVVALSVWMLADGMSWPATLLVAAGLNLVGAVIVGLRLRRIFDDVPFSATLRQIKSDTPQHDSAH